MPGGPRNVQPRRERGSTARRAGGRISTGILIGGAIFVALVYIFGIALAKAAAEGDRQAELSRLPFRPRLVEPEPERPAAPVVPLATAARRKRS